jgi:phosphoglycolate phosphatase
VTTDLRPLAGAVIVFDLDGTLVDTAPDLIGSLNGVLAEQGLPPVALSDARHLVGQGAKAMIERGFAQAGEPLPPDRIPALFDRFIDFYLGRIAQESLAFEDLTITLDLLAADGAALAVCTNKRTDLSLALLDALDLTWRFAAVIGPDRAPASKPDPRHLLTAIAAAGGLPARALMVGDSISDVLAAKAAGVPVAVVSFGYTETPAAELGGDVMIDHFTELPALARRLLARP